MPNYGVQYRNSAYSEFHVSHVKPVRFTVYKEVNGVIRPVDLTYYDSVKLQIMDSESDASLRQQITLTVQTADADKVTDSDGTTLVAARASGDVSITGATGNVVLKLVGVKITAYTLLGLPWRASLYSAGPIS